MKVAMGQASSPEASMMSAVRRSGSSPLLPNCSPFSSIAKAIELRAAIVQGDSFRAGDNSKREMQQEAG